MDVRTRNLTNKMESINEKKAIIAEYMGYRYSDGRYAMLKSSFLEKAKKYIFIFDES